MFQEFFSGGSIVMQIFLLFSDQISGAKVSEEGKLLEAGRPLPPCGRKPASKIHEIGRKSYDFGTSQIIGNFV